MGGWAASILTLLLLPAVAGAQPPLGPATTAAPVAVAATLHRTPAGPLLAEATLHNRTATPVAVEVEVAGARITRRFTLPGLARRDLDLLVTAPAGPVVVTARAAGHVVETEAEPLPPLPPAATVAAVADAVAPPPADPFTALPDHWAPLLAYGAWVADESTLASATPAQGAAITAARRLGATVTPAAEGQRAAPLLPSPPPPGGAAFPAPLATALLRLAALLGVAAALALVAAFFGRAAPPATAVVVLAAVAAAPRLAPPTTTTLRYGDAPPLQRATVTAAGFGRGPLVAAKAAAWSPQATPPGLRWVIDDTTLVLEQTGPLAAPVRAVAVGLPDALPFHEVGRGG